MSTVGGDNGGRGDTRRTGATRRLSLQGTIRRNACGEGDGKNQSHMPTVARETRWPHTVNPPVCRVKTGLSRVVGHQFERLTGPFVFRDAAFWPDGRGGLRGGFVSSEAIPRRGDAAKAHAQAHGSK